MTPPPPQKPSWIRPWDSEDPDQPAHQLPDRDTHYPLIELSYTAAYIDKQQKPLSECVDEQTEQGYILKTSFLISDAAPIQMISFFLSTEPCQAKTAPVYYYMPLFVSYATDDIQINYVYTKGCLIKEYANLHDPTDLK